MSSLQSSLTKPLVLAIESSCDETAVAIYGKSSLSNQDKLLTSLISSQINIHRLYGGIVPEVASRNHTLRIEPLLREALAETQLTISHIDAFAATGGPGLASSLLIGHSFAKGLALAARKPFLSINHMEGHLLSPFLNEHLSTNLESQISNLKLHIPPHLALIVSGGHTMLIKVDAVGQYTLLGQTIDDAAGEAFDKVGRMLNLPYPGGPEIEKLARQGSPTAFDFPRSLLRGDTLNFSFSGLKTAVLYTIQKSQAADLKSQIPDLCASFQAAVFEVLIAKTLRAAQAHQLPLVTLSGGVSCNAALRQQLDQACHQAGLALLSATPAHSTDNAAMIAYAAWHKHQAGISTPLTTDINPNLKLAPHA